MKRKGPLALLASLFLLIAPMASASTLGFWLTESSQKGVEDFSPCAYSLSDGLFAAFFDSGIIATDFPMAFGDSRALDPSRELMFHARAGGSDYLLRVHLEMNADSKPGEYRYPLKARYLLIDLSSGKKTLDKTISALPKRPDSLDLAKSASYDLGVSIANAVSDFLKGNKS
jgi:hypothetical protein